MPRIGRHKRVFVGKTTIDGRSDELPEQQIVRRCKNMTNRNSNSINVPEAREAMDKFKMEAASEFDVPKQ